MFDYFYVLNKVMKKKSRRKNRKQSRTIDWVSDAKDEKIVFRCHTNKQTNKKKLTYKEVFNLFIYLESVIQLTLTTAKKLEQSMLIY